MTAAATISHPSVTDYDDRPAKPRNWGWLPWGVLGLCMVLFVTGERSIPYAGPNEWGLIGSASPAYALSIVLAVTGFTIAIRQANIKAAVVATLATVAVLQLPRSTATDMPMYAWTYKHLGVVDYIQHSHALARDVDIYNGWPGLFALTAWFSDLTGVSPTIIAHWWIPGFHLLFVLLMYGVARAWGLAPLTAVTAMFLVAALNWVEQDYFSPQSTAILLTAGLIALLGLSRERPVGVWLIMILFAAITITHQLTPFWLLGMIGILVISRNLKPWWIVFPLAAMAVAQLGYNWDEISRFHLLSFDIFQNTKTNLGRWGFHPVLAQKVVAAGNRIQSASLWGATALVLLVRWRRNLPFLALGALAFSGLGLVGGLDYGGESVFRVYLYCLMGCSVVLAPGLVALLQGSLRRYVASLVAVLIMTFLAVNGNSGSWYPNVMPKLQVETSKIVLSQAELPAYLTVVAPTWPERSTWQYVGYARFNKAFDVPMIYAASLVNRHFDTDEDYRKMVDALNTRSDASTYLIMTDQMQVYCWYFGVLPWDALPNLKKRLYSDPQRWEPFYDGNGIAVFVHRIRPQPRPESDPGPGPLGNSASTGSISRNGH
jgi:hypothetical protein